MQERYPDQWIANSCENKAQIRNVFAKVWMIRGTAQLRPDLVGYDDLLKLAFAANDVDHQVEVDMSVRVWRGRKIRLWRYKKCIQWGRFTCDGIKGSSKGTTFYPIQLLFMRLNYIWHL